MKERVIKMVIALVPVVLAFLIIFIIKHIQ